MFGNNPQANVQTPIFQKSNSLFGTPTNNAPSSGAQASGLFQPQKSSFGGNTNGLQTSMGGGASGGGSTSLFGNNTGGIMKKQNTNLYSNPNQ